MTTSPKKMQPSAASSHLNRMNMNHYMNNPHCASVKTPSFRLSVAKTQLHIEVQSLNRLNQVETCRGRSVKPAE